MYRIRPFVATLLVIAFLSLNVTVLGQQRRTSTATARGVAAAPSRLTGVYRLDVRGSDDPRIAAARAVNDLPPDQQRLIVESLIPRLESPEQLAIERRGQLIQIASSRAPRIGFEADGRERQERAADGHPISTRAVLYGEQLMVSTSGSPDDEFTVTFDSIENGRRLRVTRRIYVAQLNEPVVVQSFYNKTSSVARWSIYNEQRPTTTTARNNTQRRFPPPAQSPNTSGNRPQPAPPIIREPVPQRPAPSPSERNGEVYVFVVPNGTQFVTTLNDDLNTAQSREGDRFTMTVSAPAQYEGATIEGHISSIKRGGRISGRPEMNFEFDQIRLRDGRTAGFDGYIESVRVPGSEDVRVNSENTSVQEGDDQTTRTAQRAAIGAAIGAIIGAIADGGKGAAIGAAVGAGVGAGSVYAQGRDDLELSRGTELIIRARAPR
ncbi:MAG: hypothetical protein H0X14_02990 [Acidobacteria bacterium]|nr:hypothetical protein [Acidobacteriota bacterium]